MIDFYNAFISYKHGPVDNKVAAHIQTQLEHFHIPGKIQKKTGKKRIQRIFRDKEELPITSNLSDTIEDALSKAEYLIVICSPNTKESVWVKREIEFFLKTHTRDHILAVISEGEPQDVLLPELLVEEVSVLQPDGTTKSFLREKEPLCCDYRLPFRKADKEELPRLAAALIGCSYDELMNRRRAYQMQRVTILGLVLSLLAFAFAGVVLRSRMRLQSSYDDTLRNQSIYLANESKRLLSNEQRIEAIQLALAALPSEGEKRPVTAEAVRALTDATLAYSPLSGSSIHAVWNYRVSSLVQTFTLPKDRSSLACLDASNTITVWDTETHETLIEESFVNQAPFSISYIDDTKLLVLSSTEYTLYDVMRGKEIWSQVLKEDTFARMDPLIPVGDKCEYFYLISSAREILRISAEDGSIMDRFVTADVFASYDKYAFQNEYSLSPDGEKIAFYISEGDNNDIGIVNLADGSGTICAFDSPSLRDLDWIDNDTIVASGFDSSKSASGEYGRRVIAPISTDIHCYSVSRGQKIWSSDFVYNDDILTSGFVNLPARDAVAYYCANAIRIYDRNSGSILGDYDVNYSLVNVNDDNEDGVLIFVTGDGGLGSPVDYYGPETVSLTYEFTNNIQKAETGNGVFILQKRTNQILCYNAYVADDEWSEIDEDMVMRQIRDDYYMDEDYLVVNSVESDGYRICAYDAKEMESLWSILLDDTYGSEFMILGVWDDELYVSAHLNYNEINILRISIEDGEVIDEESVETISGRVRDACSMTDGYLTYIYKDEKADGYRIRGVDLETGKKEKFVLPFDSFEPNSAPRYYKQAQAIYYSDKVEGDYIIDIAEHEDYKVKLPRDWTGTTVVEVKDDGKKWIVADSAHVLILDNEGHMELELDLNGQIPTGAAFYSPSKGTEQILVVYDEGFMFRYDAESGAFIGRSEVETYPGYAERAKIRFSEDGKTIFIQTYFITDVVDVDTWVELAVVWNSLGYHEGSDGFYSFSYTGAKDYRVGYFRHYTLQDLIDKAHKILGGAELTQEQKSQYGIS